MKHIVIIGGGFGGLNLIRNLKNDADFTITLVDKNNYTFFPPLLYQIATGFLEVSNVSYPFRKLLRKIRNVRFWLGEFQKVDSTEKKVILSTGVLSYDYLVFASGTVTNYFGMENVQKGALSMKTLNDAIELRNHLLEQLELASVTTDPVERKKRLTVVVAGGGPTGVEISGMLADMKRDLLKKDHPEIAQKSDDVSIYLVDGSDAVLKPMSDKTHQYTYQALQGMGVSIKLNLVVKDYVDDVVCFANGEKIESKTLIWAAGVCGTKYEGIPEQSYGRGNRLLVDPFNQVKGVADVYAIGDISLQLHEQAFPDGHPQMAQIAIQQGKKLAENLKAHVHKRSQNAFVYNNKGSMAIIGRNKAVVDLPNNVHFQGFMAWLMWLFIHLISLENRRNRLTTLYNWMTAYITRDQALRMIIRHTSKTKKTL